MSEFEVTLQLKINKLERQVGRLRELNESQLALIRKYQDEREGLLDRAKAAIIGAEEVSNR